VIGDWLTPPLLPAVVGMVLLALVPRRWRVLQLLAVLGWAAVWVDNQLNVAWLDGIGLAAAACGLVGIACAASRKRPLGQHGAVRPHGPSRPPE
jgi:hypothetical protein